MGRPKGNRDNASVLTIQRSGRRRECANGSACPTTDEVRLVSGGYSRVRRTKRANVEQRHDDTQLNKTNYNPQQLEAINHGTGPMCVYACAGGGKTKSMIGRIVRLVRELNVYPSTILATTFTTKAAGEIRERLEKEDVFGVNVCTMHSFCWTILKEYGSVKDWSVDDKDVYTQIIKDAVSYKNLNWKRCDLSSIQRFISLAKNSLIRAEMANAWEKFGEEPFNHDERYIQVYFFAEEERLRRKLITFDDMLIDGVELLQQDAMARGKVQMQYEWVIVDEAQDSNLAQIALIELVAAPRWNVTIVGDIDQCQPPGTMVSLPNRKTKPIEEIQVLDYVSVWDNSTGRESGMRKVTRVGDRYYTGLLYNVLTANVCTNATDNHKFTVKFNYDVERWVVYLMYRADLGYRVGWCKFFAKHKGEKKSLHFFKRCRIEKADAAWVLKSFDNPSDASIYESIVSTLYGITLLPFEPSKRAVHYTRERLDKAFSAFLFHDLKKKVNNVFRSHDRKYDYPLYAPNIISRLGGSPILETTASNLLEDVMMIPSFDGWTPIKDITAVPYNGKVYSLEVEQKHNYFADGIGVNNCIYEWRGSKPKFFLDFPGRAKELSGVETKMVILPMNYRCREEIIMRAAECIRNNTERVEIPFTAFKKEPATIIYRQAADQDDEAEIVLGEVQNLLAGEIHPREIIVLMRTNAQSRSIEEVFSREKIPHVILGGGSFYRRNEVCDLLSYLRIIANPYDYDAGMRSLTKPFRYIGRDAMQQIEHQRDGSTSFFDAVLFVAAANCKYGRQLNAYNREMNEFIEWYHLVKKVENHYPTTGELLSKIVRETKFVEFTLNAEGGDSAENSRAANIGELIRSASRYRSITEFLDFVRWQTEQREKNKTKKNAIQVSTIHKQKGLEAKAVFVIGLNDGILPHAKSQIEEERRLYYVAITRAEEFLHLSSVNSLGMAGLLLAPSPFLLESGMIPTPK